MKMCLVNTMLNLMHCADKLFDKQYIANLFQV